MVSWVWFMRWWIAFGNETRWIRLAIQSWFASPYCWEGATFRVQVSFVTTTTSWLSPSNRSSQWPCCATAPNTQTHSRHPLAPCGDMRRRSSWTSDAIRLSRGSRWSAQLTSQRSVKEQWSRKGLAMVTEVQGTEKWWSCWAETSAGCRWKRERCVQGFWIKVRGMWMMCQDSCEIWCWRGRVSQEREQDHCRFFACRGHSGCFECQGHWLKFLPLKGVKESM